MIDGMAIIATALGAVTATTILGFTGMLLLTIRNSK